MNVERKHREIIGNKEEIFFSLASLSSTDGASRHVPLGICSSWLSLSATCRGAPGYCRLGVLSSGSDRFFPFLSRSLCYGFGSCLSFICYGLARNGAPLLCGS
jgi:hypothetical protein